MRKAKEFGSEPVIENKLYLYQNAFGTYSISLIPEVEMRTKYAILCHANQIVEAVSKELDAIVKPAEYDLLDMTLCSYNVADILEKVFYLSSYTVKIELIEERNSITTQTDDDTIQLPFFNVDQDCRIIKDFKSFK